MSLSETVATVPIAELIFWLCMFGGAISLVLVMVNIARIIQFEKRIGQLPTTSLPDDEPFSGESEFAKNGNAYVESFRRSATRHILESFVVDQRSAHVRGTLSASSAWPRAIVGLLVLGSLLVTLLNMQISVAHLGDAFRGLSASTSNIGSAVPSRAPTAAKSNSRQAKDPNKREPNKSVSSGANPNTDSQGDKVERIQRAMASIADSARTAFQRSGWIILIGVLTLALNTYATRTARQSSLKFVKWAHTAYDEAFSQRISRDPTSRMADLAKLINKMHEISSSFQETSGGLAELGQLGIKLDQSTLAISDAISRLPDSVRTSVTGLGGEVARYISEDLKHQLEYLKSVAAIYGDQETRIQEIQKILIETSQATQTSAAALKALPGEITNLRKSITKHAESTDALREDLTALSRKVDALPIMDLKAASEDIHGAIQRLADTGNAISGYATKLSEFLAGWRSAIHGEVNDVSKAVANSMQNISRELLASLNVSNDATRAAVQKLQRETDRLMPLLESLDKRTQSQAKESGDRLSRVSQELETLTKAVTSLNSAASSSAWARIFGRSDSKDRNRAAGA